MFTVEPNRDNDMFSAERIKQTRRDVLKTGLYLGGLAGAWIATKKLSSQHGPRPVIAAPDSIEALAPAYFDQVSEDLRRGKTVKAKLALFTEWVSGDTVITSPLIFANQENFYQVLGYSFDTQGNIEKTRDGRLKPVVIKPGEGNLHIVADDKNSLSAFLDAEIQLLDDKIVAVHHQTAFTNETYEDGMMPVDVMIATFRES